jgi:hypothetical protein
VSAEELKLYQTRIITVMDNDDDFRVHAFPVNETITFDKDEKSILRLARHSLIRANYSFICDAVTDTGPCNGPIELRIIHKIKTLLAEAAMGLGLDEEVAEKNIRTLDALCRVYWAEERELTKLLFRPGDCHLGRIAWLTHLIEHY